MDGGTRISLEHRGWDPLVVRAGDPTLDHYLDRWTALLASFETQALERQLLELSSVFRDAVSAGDSAFLDAHMADDAVLVFGDRRYLKDEVVAHHRRASALSRRSPARPAGRAHR